MAAHLAPSSVAAAAAPTRRDLGRLMRRFKGLSPGTSPLVLPLVDESGRRLGALEAIGARLASEARTVDLLTGWRRSNMDHFLTQFDPTPARTALWLRDSVLEDDGRILFLIRDADGRPVGQYGLCGVEPGRAELDNAIRGEPGAPGLMLCAELHLLALALRPLRAELGLARVFSNNLAARLLHKEVGLQCVRSQYLRSARVGHELRYEPTDKPVRETAGLMLLTLAIGRAEFERQHAWVRLGPLESGAARQATSVRPASGE